MLRSLKDLENYTVSAKDGDIGSVANFLVDDERWAMRYLVVSTGGFFNGRQVLISPVFFRDVDWGTHRFHLGLTKDKVKNSPDLDTDQPVSRQHERDYYHYYGYPSYWGSSGVWGIGIAPALMKPLGPTDPYAEATVPPDDMHLRSIRELRGYHIQGNDGTLGHIEDFIIDDETWEVRYLVIDTSNWWFGKKVLVSPLWASSVSWELQTVQLALSQQRIKDSPEWNPSAPINREYEGRLYDYYGRPVYWE